MAMVIKDLYSFRVSSRKGNEISALVSINPAHPVYKGHFPGFPISPGVCQVLMIREILEEELGTSLVLTGARQIKFTAVHEPGKYPEIDATISFERNGDRLRVDARLQKNEKVFIKFKGEYREQK